jgi:hydroxymethylpyrimidine pyrophosphatase-like HAD family hydrolase
MKLINKETVYFDVDDTLVIWEGQQYRPHLKHINALKQHALRGHFVVVWSAGGFDWAHRIVNELNLINYVDAVMSKPKWIYDDMDPNNWTTRIYIKEDK